MHSVRLSITTRSWIGGREHPFKYPKIASLHVAARLQSRWSRSVASRTDWGNNTCISPAARCYAAPCLIAVGRACVYDKRASAET